MKRLLPWITPALLLFALAACTAPTRKSMFPPTLMIQQMHVQPDGRWNMQLRILNNSYGAMEFRALHLTLLVNQQPVTQIDTSLKLAIPPLSADVTDVTITPNTAARQALARIADKGSAGSLAYAFKGTASAIPGHADKPRDFKVDSHDWLSAVPGIADTYR